VNLGSGLPASTLAGRAPQCCITPAHSAWRAACRRTAARLGSVSRSATTALALHLLEAAGESSTPLIPGSWATCADQWGGGYAGSHATVVFRPLPGERCPQRWTQTEPRVRLGQPRADPHSAELPLRILCDNTQPLHPPCNSLTRHSVQDVDGALRNSHWAHKLSAPVQELCESSGEMGGPGDLAHGMTRRAELRGSRAAPYPCARYPAPVYAHAQRIRSALHRPASPLNHGTRRLHLAVALASSRAHIGLGREPHRSPR
jgi:hypothetical protein